MELLAALATGCAVWLHMAGASLVRLNPVAVEEVGAGDRRERGRAIVASLRARLHRRRGTTARTEVSHLCELLALGLRAGAPPRVALAHVVMVTDAEADDPLAKVLHQIDLGIDEAQAWSELGEAPGFRRVARDVSRSIRHGSVMADLLLRHASEARSDGQARALARARVAGVRSVIPLVTCFLPAFLLVGVVPVLAGTFAQLFG